MTTISSSEIFNRKLLAKHRDRAANTFHKHNFLYKLAAEEIIARLEGRNYDSVLEIGYTGIESAKALKARTHIITDTSPKMLDQIKHFQNSPSALLVDEEQLPFKANCFDLVISNLNLHFINNIPATLAQINHILKPGGVFIAALIGGASLIELRRSLLEAESLLNKEISPHIIPMIDTKDAASLLQHARFSMPVADSFTINVTYQSIFKLMNDLKNMAQNNCLVQIPYLSRDIIRKAEEIYEQKYSHNHRISASFEIVMMFGIKNGGQ